MVAVGIFEPRSWVVKPETISSARAGVKEHGGRPGADEDYFARSEVSDLAFREARSVCTDTAHHDGPDNVCPLLPPYFALKSPRHGQHRAIGAAACRQAFSRTGK